MKTIDNVSDILTLPSGKTYNYFSIIKYAAEKHQDLERMPFSVRVLLEAALRRGNKTDAENLISWKPGADSRSIIQFFPGRVLLQDLTGVPVIVDLAALRSAAARQGITNLEKINPCIPVDLVIDHSLHVDYSGSAQAMAQNLALEFSRNNERYTLLRWAQQAFTNLRIVPPATGIIHQVNIENLSQGVLTQADKQLVFPDTLIGTDSHTTMANGLGILGWGVGGIEAIAAMLGQGIELPIPDVIGVRLTGELPEGTTPTDLTLTLTQLLRKRGVVDCFVEYCGPGLDSLSPADRCMIANMSPENGATASFFPVDDQTLDYFRLTGRPPELIELIEVYSKAQGLFREKNTPEPLFTDLLELDLGTIEPSLAGPSRPQDRVSLKEVSSSFHKLLPDEGKSSAKKSFDDKNKSLTNGSVVIAAITSCTNTSNPYGLLTAGALAAAAVKRGLRPPTYVKTSFTPGSRAAAELLKHAGLMDAFDALGFNVAGYGCATCIGNSGPLLAGVEERIQKENLVAAAVISGNRNFEGRVHAAVKANFLASPPLVVAYALAGTVEIDLSTDPLGLDEQGNPVYLRDLWPSQKKIRELMEQTLQPDLFTEGYTDIFTGNQAWNEIQFPSGLTYAWDNASTYLQEPPYFDLQPVLKTGKLEGARVLAMFGNSITTDHISPAGSIAPNSPAAHYLESLGVSSSSFNSYGARRGNDRVMARGTFANIRLKNKLMKGEEGSFTCHLPSNERMSIYDAAMRYQTENVPLIVIAGKEYGTGSSRDWAAKGPRLLGVKAVLAESFERIHRSNLAGMGILPLQYKENENAESLGLSGREIFSINGMENGLTPGMDLSVTAVDEEGQQKTFNVTLRLNSTNEVDYIYTGGILSMALSALVKQN